MSERKRMLAGDLYLSNEPELNKMHQECREALDKINSTHYDDFEGRYQIIKKLFKSVGENIAINKPFHFDYGHNITIGNHFYANYDCLLLDANEIIIGNDVFFGPKVSLLTAGHPLDADIRISELEFAKKIVIEDGVWIGGSVVVNPGVTIGKNSVIGSGSVVTKNIPENVIAVGNPCRVLRNIDDNDKKHWQNFAKIYFEQKANNE